MLALCAMSWWYMAADEFHDSVAVPNAAGKAAKAMSVGLHTFQLMGRQVSAVKVETSQDTGRDTEENGHCTDTQAGIGYGTTPCVRCCRHYCCCRSSSWLVDKRM